MNREILTLEGEKLTNAERLILIFYYWGFILHVSARYNTKPIFEFDSDKNTFLFGY